MIIAEEYNQLEEKYDAAYQKWLEEIDSMQKKIELLDTTIRQLEEEYETEKEYSQALEETIQQLNASIIKITELHDDLVEKVKQIELENESLNEENKKLKEQKEALEKKLGAKPPPQSSSPAPGRSSFYIANYPSGKVAYLTFDDGPSHNTQKILDILDEYKVKATFFVNGNRSPFGHQMYKEIVGRGHALGNHTFSHNYSTIYSSVNHFFEDFYQLENELYQVVGFKPKLVRFPGGSNNQVSRQFGGQTIMYEIAWEMLNRGYVYFDWNVDSRDAQVRVQDKQVIVDSVLKGSANLQAAIILMHDSAPKTTTVEALPEIIEGLKKQGFRFEVMTPESFIVQFNRPSR